jgi:hypothetical protein
MCHNLGGLDIISSSQLITYEHPNDRYARVVNVQSRSESDLV